MRSAVDSEKREVLERQGYRIVGEHSGVKLCHWTKASLTKGAGAFLAGRDGTIYGSTARDLIVLRPAGAESVGKPVTLSAPSPLRPRVWLEAP